jgi:acetylornithine deacetylase/succinyl-diaminopimelate desuccinylase-like protein
MERINFERSPDEGVLGLEQAAQYIEKEFLKMGLDVKENPFQWQGKSYRNIVGDKAGKTFPDRVLILGAHYDTVPGSPGADDNASAVSVLLEVARAIQAVPLKYTVRFIAFSEYEFVGARMGSVRKKKPVPLEDGRLYRPETFIPINPKPIRMWRFYHH